MKRNIFIFSMIILGVLLFSSCAGVHRNYVKMHEDTKDHVTADVDVSYDRAYDASLETIRAMGGVSLDNKSEGWIKSQQHDNSSISVQVERLTDHRTQIIVTATRLEYPQPTDARDIMEKILHRIKDQPFWMN